MFVKQRIQMSFAYIVAIASAVILMTAFLSTAASAQTTANTLKVSPVRSDVEVKAGSVKIVQMTVSNLTSEDITVKPVVNDFVSGDETGTPALILDDSQYANSRSLKRFITPLANITIPANEAKTVDVVITVPKDAKAGGYFGAIRFSPTTPDTGGQVNLSPSVASLILLTVPGPTTELLELTRFETTQDGKPGGFFLSNENIQTSFRFQNKGDIQLGPFGKISVKQGSKVVYEADFNIEDPRDMVLPDGARVWDVPLENIGSVGHYTVLATFTYGTKNQTVEVTKSFWVIPIWLIIAAGGLVLFIVALIIFIRFFAGRHKRRIQRYSGRGHRYDSRR